MVLGVIVLGLTPEWMVASGDDSQHSAYEKYGVILSPALFLSCFQSYVFTASPSWLLHYLTWGTWVKSLKCLKNISSKTNLDWEHSHHSWNMGEGGGRPVQLQMVENTEGRMTLLVKVSCYISRTISLSCCLRWYRWQCWYNFPASYKA